jgi:hypothetical protein
VRVREMQAYLCDASKEENNTHMGIIADIRLKRVKTFICMVAHLCPFTQDLGNTVHVVSHQ